MLVAQLNHARDTFSTPFCSLFSLANQVHVGFPCVFFHRPIFSPSLWAFLFSLQIHELVHSSPSLPWLEQRSGDRSSLRTRCPTYTVAKRDTLILFRLVNHVHTKFSFVLFYMSSCLFFLLLKMASSFSCLPLQPSASPFPLAFS
jgi:hypothetical protein